MESFRKSSVQLAKLNELSVFQVPRSGARYSTEEKTKPMATLARLAPQTVKLVYHQAQEAVPHKEHVSHEPQASQKSERLMHRMTLEVCILT